MDKNTKKVVLTFFITSLIITIAQLGGLYILDIPQKIGSAILFFTIPISGITAALSVLLLTVFTRKSIYQVFTGLLVCFSLFYWQALNSLVNLLNS